jgi:hypothetical protein
MLRGFSTTLSMNGELLVLSVDNKFYRIIIGRATISDITSNLGFIRKGLPEIQVVFLFGSKQD